MSVKTSHVKTSHTTKIVKSGANNSFVDAYVEMSNEDGSRSYTLQLHIPEIGAFDACKNEIKRIQCIFDAAAGDDPAPVAA